VLSVRGYPFTEDLRGVLRRAGAEAARRGEAAIGTEHVLLGVLTAGSVVSALVLERAGARAALLHAVDAVGPQGQHPPVAEAADLPYAAETRRVFELSMDEAVRLRHAAVAPEHLLIALAREEDGPGGRALRAAGLDADRLRAAVWEGCGGPPGNVPRAPWLARWRRPWGGPQPG
jgi:ATP-dependent Clp protease ATP-binding subunit ClpC